MRILVAICIVNAIILSLTMAFMWVWSSLGKVEKPIDFTPMTYLIGVFVSALTFKAIQSFSPNERGVEINEDEEEIVVKGNWDEK
jgi:sterol desaturase/sphingolipid hydroxylase (fatty acid hydroxylase superfamily)